ncbi:unnamed protein product [Linum tenue]|uniref:Uncharacterized protein n=1 Tax=Linum tenue TaxID=586396 RepID=A0AAV0L3V9_9ROSI|nr:unnamed protein product [Linum tenue]
MFNFGDELTLQSSRIPWLIWIQILVLALIIFLFYSFSITPTDDASLSSSSAGPASADSPSSSYRRDPDDMKNIAKHDGGGDSSTAAADYIRQCQVTRSQSIKGEVAMPATTGRRIVREEATEGDGVTNYHPCNYIRLAKLVFLKCFGLDCELERSSSSEKKKRR